MYYFLGENITVTGTNFGTDQGTVFLNSLEAIIYTWTDTQIELSTPDLTPGSYTLRVLVGTFGCAENR